MQGTLEGLTKVEGNRVPLACAEPERPRTEDCTTATGPEEGTRIETDHQRAVRYVTLTGFARDVIREWPPEIAKIITLARAELLEELIRQAGEMHSLGEFLSALADLAEKEHSKLGRRDANAPEAWIDHQMANRAGVEL